MSRRSAGRHRRSFTRARAEADAAAAGQPLPPLPGEAKKRPRHIEDDEQEFIFQKWAPVAVLKWPEVALLHAVPNGGRRNKFEAERLRRQGVKAGMLDMDLPVEGYIKPVLPPPGQPATIEILGRRYVGLRIELKRPWIVGGNNEYPSHDQKWWMSALQDAGHCVCLCYGAAQAIASLEAYLTGLPVPHQWSRK